MPVTSRSSPGGGTRKRTQAPPTRATGARFVGVDLLAERSRERSAVQIDSERDAAELGVVPAAEPCGELADTRPVRPDEHLGVARPVLDPDCCRCSGSRLDDGADLGRFELARPRMRQRDAEGRQRRGQAIGHRERIEVAAGREGVDGHLDPGNMLLDEQRCRARRVERDAHGLGDVLCSTNEREPALTLAVGRFDHAGEADSLGGGSRFLRAGTDLVRGLGHPGLRETLALAQLRRGQRRRLRRDRVRQPQPFGDPCGDRDRPVDARRDQPVDALGACEPFDPGLVLRRDDRAAVGVAKARSGRIAVERDHMQLTRTRRGEQAQLGRPGT